MPRIPGVPDVVALLKAQTEALMELPATVASLQRAVRSLADVVTAGGETLLVVQRLAVRIDRIVDELEEPVLLLAPGLRRTAAVLDDPIVATIPDTVRTLQAEVLPLLRAISETQARLMALPGAALLGSLTGRRTVPAAEPGPGRVRPTPGRPAGQSGPSPD